MLFLNCYFSFLDANVLIEYIHMLVVRGSVFRFYVQDLFLRSTFVLEKGYLWLDMFGPFDSFLLRRPAWHMYLYYRIW